MEPYSESYYFIVLTKQMVKINQELQEEKLFKNTEWACLSYFEIDQYFGYVSSKAKCWQTRMWA